MRKLKTNNVLPKIEPYMNEIEKKNNSEFFTPKYDLSEAEVLRLSDELLYEKALDIPDNYRHVIIEVGGKSKYANLCRYVEGAVFEKTFGYDTARMHEEYGPYEASSRFILSVDRLDGKPVGSFRIITNSEAGFQTLNDMQDDPFNIKLDDAVEKHGMDDFDRIWDLSTLAVLPEYQNCASSVDMYYALNKSAEMNGIDHYISIIDDRALRLLRDVIGIPFVPLADSKPAPYCGSEKSSAVYSSVPGAYNELCDRFKTAKNGRLKSMLDRIVNDSTADSVVFDNTL